MNRVCEHLFITAARHALCFRGVSRFALHSFLVHPKIHFRFRVPPELLAKFVNLRAVAGIHQETGTFNQAIPLSEAVLDQLPILDR